MKRYNDSEGSEERVSVLFFKTSVEGAASAANIMAWILFGIVILRLFGYDIVGMVVDPIRDALGLNTEEDVDDAEDEG